MFHEILVDGYGFRNCTIAEQKGGWSALAFRVDVSGTSYFLKAYPKNRASTPKLTAHLEDYLSVVARLGKEKLAGRIVRPVPTRSGRYRCEDREYIFVLFEYVEGPVLGDRELSASQVDAFAAIAADLHDINLDAPDIARLPVEDFAVPLRDGPERFLKTGSSSRAGDIERVVLPALKAITDAVTELRERARVLEAFPPRFVLCHTDLHGWNLIDGSESPVLLDWEGLKRAPAEADLFILADRPYYPRFLTAYAQKRPAYRPNTAAMAFYALRRRLEDIEEFLEQLTSDEIKGDCRKTALNHLAAECEFIRRRASSCA